MHDFSTDWLEKTGTTVARFLCGLVLLAFGLGVMVVASAGLMMPDAKLVESYVGFIAGFSAALESPVVHGGAVPVLAAVVIGVRLVLVAGLLAAVCVVNEGRKFWR